MTLPTLEKTYEFDVNQAVGGLGSVDPDNRDCYFKIKQSLIGLPSGQWIVSASSDGVVANLADNWADPATDLVYNTPGNPHSWIVLTNTGNGAQLCMTTNVAFASSETAGVYLSPGGNYVLAGLVTTARPVAADEVHLNDATVGTTWGGGSNLGWNGILHVLCSTDGEVTRIIVCRSGTAVGIWCVDSVRQPVSGWTDPVVGCCYGNVGAGDFLTYANLLNVAKFRGYAASGFYAFLTGEGYAGNPLVAKILVADAQSGGWFMAPIGLASETALNVGRKGSLYDFYWGSRTRVTGDTYPADGSYQFAQFGDFIVPWNGTLPVVT